jgi:NAD(P)H-dependent FMN reductase
MIVVLSGTNRPEANTRHVAQRCARIVRAEGEEATLLDLGELPPALFSPDAYADKPPEFADWQQAVLDAAGILVVVPEYNGSFPGALKYFIDMLRFPESLYEKPCGFVGLASGRFGGLRAVEQLEMVFQYRHAHLYGRRCFLAGIHQHLDADGALVDPALETRLRDTVTGFVEFCRRLSD